MEKLDFEKMDRLTLIATALSPLLYLIALLCVLVGFRKWRERKRKAFAVLEPLRDQKGYYRMTQNPALDDAVEYVLADISDAICFDHEKNGRSRQWEFDGALLTGTKEGEPVYFVGLTDDKELTFRLDRMRDISFRGLQFPDGLAFAARFASYSSSRVNLLTPATYQVTVRHDNELSA